MLTVSIACYNEAENIKRFEKELLPVLRKLKMPFEVLLIDDGSKDSTLLEAEKLVKKHREFRVIKHPRNLGLGAGIKTGIREAKGDLLILLDADLTFHPDQIPVLFQRFNKGDVDCVIGSHFQKGGKLEKVPFYRIFLSKGVNICYNILLGKKIKAISSIFRLYKTEQLRELKLESNGFDLNAEILVKLIRNRRRVAEVPVTLTTRIYGVSKLNNFKEAKNHIKLLSKILWWKLTRRK